MIAEPFCSNFFEFRIPLFPKRILSYKCADTKALAKGQRIKRFEKIERVVLRKIRQLQIAESLENLKVPPGNRLEALKGERAGQYSIRINDQFRICFIWTEGIENIRVKEVAEDIKRNLTYV